MIEPTDAMASGMMEEQGPPVSAPTWNTRLEQYQREMERWNRRCENIDKLYGREERSDAADREYSIFWANLEVLRPAVYARPPTPVVAPRFKDGKPLHRTASDVMERSLIVTFEQGDIDGVMREARDELLRYGRGSAWVRIDQQPDGKPAVAFDEVLREDFAHEIKPTWRQVSWVARRAWMSREDGRKRFGDVFDRVPVKKRDPKSAVTKSDDEAPVWEIWCKKSGHVYWVSPGCQDMLDYRPVYLTLRDFFPCPRPAYGTRVPKKLVPVPDIVHYKDQIEEVNELTARISGVTEILRLKGFYPAGQGELSEAIETAIKSLEQTAILIPIASFAAMGAGGFKDQIVWMPIRDALELVRGLIELRRVIIEDIYQITGISDIVRGASNASETATAQQIKSQWGSLRIRERQTELARFARDLTRIAAEIIAENFDPATLAEMSQMDLLTNIDKMRAQVAMQDDPSGEPDKRLQQPTIEEVAAFLANDRARSLAIEIETDSTIQPDEDAEKQRRIEYVTSVGGLLQASAPIVMQAPQIGPFIGELLNFAAGGFRAGRPMEAAIDQLTSQLEKAAQMAMQPKEPQPDPKAEAIKMKAEADVMGARAKAEATVTAAQAKIATTQMDMQSRQQAHMLAMAGGGMKEGEDAGDFD